MEFYFLIASICILLGCLDNVTTVVSSDDPRSRCGAYCFQALKPLLDHLSVLDKITQVCDAGKLTKSESRLDKIEGQMAAQANTSTSHGNAIVEVKQQLTEHNNLLKKYQKVPNKKFQKIGTGFYHIEQQEKVNWFGAAHKCTQLGGHLLSLNNQQELDALIPFLYVNKYYWTDISDLAEEHVYRSLSTGLKAEFLPWRRNEPNKAGQENCVHLHPLSSFQLNDINCNDRYYFICEFDE